MYHLTCQNCGIIFDVKERRQTHGPRKRKFCTMKCSSTFNYKKDPEKVLQTCFKVGHSYHPRKTKTIKIRQPIKLFGPDNPAFKDGKRSGRGQKIYKSTSKLCLMQECLICKSLKNLHVHHKDTNNLNHSLNNLCVLCNSCHQSLHKLMKKHNRILFPNEVMLTGLKRVRLQVIQTSS